MGEASAGNGVIPGRFGSQAAAECEAILRIADPTCVVGMPIRIFGAPGGHRGCWVKCRFGPIVRMGGCRSGIRRLPGRSLYGRDLPTAHRLLLWNTPIPICRTRNRYSIGSGFLRDYVLLSAARFGYRGGICAAGSLDISPSPAIERRKSPWIVQRLPLRCRAGYLSDRTSFTPDTGIRPSTFPLRTCKTGRRPNGSSPFPAERLWDHFFRRIFFENASTVAGPS